MGCGASKTHTGRLPVPLAKAGKNAGGGSPTALELSPKEDDSARGGDLIQATHMEIGTVPVDTDGCGAELEGLMTDVVGRKPSNRMGVRRRSTANINSDTPAPAPAHEAPAPVAKAAYVQPHGTTQTVTPLLDKAVTRTFMALNAHIPAGKCVAEYVWVGGTGEDVRSKQRVLNAVPASPSDLPTWNYDGSSTGQAPGEDSEVLLKPRAIFKNPFLGAPHILVMCDTFAPPTVDEEFDFVSDPTPIPTNTRAACEQVMLNPVVDAQDIWFGMEQEYTLLDADTKWPLGWPKAGFPGPQGPYYCSAGAGCAIGRDIATAHMMACLQAGIEISGTNAEVMPAQWEYQVGPCRGMAMGDQLWMSRYLMHRVCEEYGVIATFDPKPIPGDWNGAGLHTNISTHGTRTAPGGFDECVRQIGLLEKRHAVHIAGYGEGNDRRLTGKHETSTIHDFSWGVANRGCSVRVGRTVPTEKCGYYEDRRPASNGDPYVITKLVAETVLLH